MVPVAVLYGMLVPSQTWLPFRCGKQGPVFVVTYGSPRPRSRRPKRPRRWRRPIPISELPPGIWKPWMEEMSKWWMRCPGDNSISVMCRNTGLRVPLNPNRSVLLRARTADLSSSMYKLVYYWHRNGQTELLKSSASLTGSFFSFWSSAR